MSLWLQLVGLLWLIDVTMIYDKSMNVVQKVIRITEGRLCLLVCAKVLAIDTMLHDKGINFYKDIWNHVFDLACLAWQYGFLSCMTTQMCNR